MKVSKLIKADSLLVMLTVFFTGCSGVGVIESSDPIRKLDDAKVLYEERDRPIMAEKLILEAIAILEANGDPHGLGHSYREYSQLIISSAVTRAEKVYRRDGFLNREITFDGRKEKSTEFLKKAIGYYLSVEEKYQSNGRYDQLTNLYLNLGVSHYYLTERVQACGYADKALLSSQENRRTTPEAKLSGEEEGQSVEDQLIAFKNSMGCK